MSNEDLEIPATRKDLIFVARLICWGALAAMLLSGIIDGCNGQTNRQLKRRLDRIEQILRGSVPTDVKSSQSES